MDGPSPNAVSVQYSTGVVAAELALPRESLVTLRLARSLVSVVTPTTRIPPPADCGCHHRDPNPSQQSV